MSRDRKWKLLKRKIVYDSKFMKVYEDSIRLPNGLTIPDYTVVKKLDGVMIVATDNQGKILVLKEYKHAASRYLLVLPAGHKEKGESVIKTARRELLEETGMTAKSFENLGTLYEYPTKDLHKLYVVRAKNAFYLKEPIHETTESIAMCRFISKRKLRLRMKRDFRSSSPIAALALAGILS